MPVSPTYPGVYIEELPSGVRTIVGVATSITAFIGRAKRGPVDKPIRVQSFADFDRQFGGLAVDSTMSYAVSQYFNNGGRDAIIVRVVHYEDTPDPDKDAAKATVSLDGAGPMTLEAANEGEWGNKLRVRVDHDTRELEEGEGADTLFNLTIKDMGTGDVESFRNVSVETDNKRYVKTILERESSFVRVDGAVPSQRPGAHQSVGAGEDPFEKENNGGLTYYEEASGGEDGDPIEDDDIVGSEADHEGLYALEDADLFNLLCIPPLERDTDIALSTYGTALTYCRKRRAMLIVDAPVGWNKITDAESGLAAVETAGLRDENAAIYFPRVMAPDPLKENRLEEFAPCGIVAGIMARTDSQRGVWKAPAGQDATVVGVGGLEYTMTDDENGRLNPLGVNCLRIFPVVGTVIWGARTLKGADRLASEWKYIPVRRVALFIEETLYRSTKWVVFEPNDEPLWSQIRLNIGTFMHRLFKQGAFQGSTPKEAYFVKCDKSTTTQADIDLGIVNIVVGFAPLKPAEFVIIKIQQIAGQSKS